MWKVAATLLAALLGVCVLVLSLPRPPATAAAAAAAADAPIAGVADDLVRVQVDSARQVIDLVVGPVSLAPSHPGYRAPIQLASIPVTGWLNGFSWFVHDGNGRRLDDHALHHFNLIDPDRTELFSAVPRRIVAAGRETPGQKLPAPIAYPLTSGTRLLVVTMLANPTAQPQVAYLTIRLNYRPDTNRLLRPFAIYPFYLDVMGPVGAKDFPVPPGRTVQSWEGTPAADARIIVLGGHMHDHARVLQLIDVASGDTLWSVAPEIVNGRLVGVPRSVVFRRGGIKLERGRRYRVTVEYQNPGTPARGMGVVGGVVTSRDRWPSLDRNHPDYVADLGNIIAAPMRAARAEASPHHH